MALTLFIHIGLPKTGTTSLQAALSSGMSIQFYYPQTGRVDDHHKAIAVLIQDAAINGTRESAELLNQCIEELCSEIASALARNKSIILSSEYFSEIDPILFDRLFVSQLISKLGAFDFGLRILASVKPIPGYWLSCFTEYSLNSSLEVLTLDQYLADWERSKTLNPVLLMCLWSDVFGEVFELSPIVFGYVPSALAAITQFSSVWPVHHLRPSVGLPVVEAINRLKLQLRCVSFYREHLNIPWTINQILSMSDDRFRGCSLIISASHYEILGHYSHEFVSHQSSCNFSLACGQEVQKILIDTRISRSVVHSNVFELCVQSVLSSLMIEGFIHYQHATHAR